MVCLIKEIYFSSMGSKINIIVSDIFERVATEASKLAAYNKKSTISSREIQTSYVVHWKLGCLYQLTFAIVCGLSFLVNLQNTPYRKAPRPSPNTPLLPNEFYLLMSFAISSYGYWGHGFLGVSGISNVLWDGFCFCFPQVQVSLMSFMVASSGEWGVK